MYIHGNIACGYMDECRYIHSTCTVHVCTYIPQQAVLGVPKQVTSFEW